MNQKYDPCTEIGMMTELILFVVTKIFQWFHYIAFSLRCSIRMKRKGDFGLYYNGLRISVRQRPFVSVPLAQ